MVCFILICPVLESLICYSGSIVVYDVSKALGNGEGLKNGQNQILVFHFCILTSVEKSYYRYTISLYISLQFVVLHGYAYRL